MSTCYNLPDASFIDNAIFNRKLLWDWVPDKINNNGRLLDIGCYKGFLKEVLGGSIEYFGCNIENFGKSYIKEYDLNLNTLPYPDKYFDIVCATNVLEHLYNPEPVCKEIKRVLKIDGYALIGLPNDLGLASLDSNLMPWIRRKICGFEEQRFEHHWKFSIDTAREFIKKYFKIEKEAFKNGIFLQKIDFILKHFPFLESEIYMLVKQN